MKHIIPFNENELLGDLRELGYKDLVGKTILYMNDNFIGWHMIVMRPSEEVKAAHAILGWYGRDEFVDHKGKPILTIHEAMSSLSYSERVTFYSISDELEVNHSVSKPQIICMEGFNPFEVTEELTKLYKGNLKELLDIDFTEGEKEIIEL
jgi:hypothetical protein